MGEYPRETTHHSMIGVPGPWRAVVRGARPMWGVVRDSTAQWWPDELHHLDEGQARAVADFANWLESQE